MSKLVKFAQTQDAYTITETTTTGKFYVTRRSVSTNQELPVFIAENETGVKNWLRTHPDVDNPTIRVTSKAYIAEAVGEGQDWGTGNSFTFSSKVTDPELGGGAVKRFGSSVLNRLFLKSMLKKALASTSPEGKHPDFTLQPTATGTFGGKEEPSHTVVVHGEVDPKAVSSALADQFKQRAVATSTTNPVTGYVKEATEEKTPLAKLIQGSIEDNQQARNVTTTRAAVDSFGRPLVRDETGTTLLPADIKRNGPRGPKGGIVNLGRGDADVAYDDQESPEEGGRRVVPSGHGPDAYETREEESTMENDDKITESMFLTGENNTLVGQSQVDYRNMLAGDLFGSAAFSTQRPHADTHEGANVVMDTQAAEGMGVLRPVGAPSANMNEDTSFNKHMLNMAKNLFRANRMDEAAKIVDALDSSDAASKVLEAAIATDGAVDEKLTEDLYNAAAYLSALNNG